MEGEKSKSFKTIPQSGTEGTIITIFVSRISRIVNKHTGK